MGFPSNTSGYHWAGAGGRLTPRLCSHVQGWIPGTSPQRSLQHTGVHFSPAGTGA